MHKNSEMQTFDCTMTSLKKKKQCHSFFATDYQRHDEEKEIKGKCFLLMYNLAIYKDWTV